MKDKKLLFDRSCHVLYSKPCKKEIRAKIALHYPEAERETVWEKVQRQYADFLADWRTDLGGKKNFHNGAGGTYDCIAIMSYYTVCKAVTSFREIEEMEENLILPIFRRLRFVNCNKPFWKKLMYRAFTTAKKRCDAWHDYEMAVAPYENDKPIYYEFTACPAAEFAKQFGFTDIMPALCNVDYASIYDAIGFPKEYHLHTLRHFFVSTLLHSGIDKQTVAELAGHADTGFLERTYCHPEMARKRDAATSMLTSIHPGGGMLFPLQTAVGK